MKITALLSLAAIALATFTASAQAKIKTEVVEYKSGDTTLQGFLAYDDANAQPRPGVLLIHDWMGVEGYAESRAKQLAELGYVAFAADIYGKGVRPADPKQAGALAGKYKGDRALYRERLKAGMAQITGNKLVAPGKVAVIGYCFGGTGALELARSGAALKGVVTFHGGLSTPTPADAKNIKCPVLILHGADDPFVNPDEVAAFKKEMEDAKVKYTFIAYPGAVHAFTRPDVGTDNSKGVAYNEAADKKSWAEMKKFFSQIFS
ncbi:MAG: dienelactone hydrolase family protein [Chthoniobacter sp.]|uniref:dienelactone hydrolase family protein n=1 Tax=Chthoniobacter sp. TaxID=2510640 RepID=UPI0032A3B177